MKKLILTLSLVSAMLYTVSASLLILAMQSRDRIVAAERREVAISRCAGNITRYADTMTITHSDFSVCVRAATQ